MSDLFVDRLGNIVVADGVARLDFLRRSALDAEKKQARMAPSVRIAIPVSGLLQAIETRRTAAPSASRPRSRPRIHPLVPH
jgi:hypothetical protein